MRAERALVEDCCGWNKKLWADALVFALSRLPERVDGMKVLEVGASRYSSVAPIFRSQGADVICSYYGEQQEELERGRLGFVIQKYALSEIPVVELDLNDFNGIYDIIIMKSVLGGVCRGDDYQRIRSVIDRLMDHVSEAGFIVSIDNGYISLFEKLRKIRGAGQSKWTYLKMERLRSSIANYQFQIRGFGLLNFGAAKFLFKRDLERVNDAIYKLDKVFLRVFESKERAVLATVIEKRTA
jgi:hypothetical protein